MSKTAEYLMDQIERAIDCLTNNRDLLDDEHLVKLQGILDSSKSRSRPAFMLANDQTFYDFNTGAKLQPDYAGLVIIDGSLFKTWIESGERNWVAPARGRGLKQVGDNFITVEIVGEHLEVHGTRSLTLVPAYSNEIKVY